VVEESTKLVKKHQQSFPIEESTDNTDMSQVWQVVHQIKFRIDKSRG
jgi:hypothetical protein